MQAIVNSQLKMQLSSVVISVIFLSTVLVTQGVLTGIIHYPKESPNTVLVSARFDNVDKLTTINKMYSNKQEVDTELHSFSTKKYLAGLYVDFQYQRKWYDSILTDYFSVDDIMVPTVYNASMSRSLSLFFTGSWMNNENVTRDAFVIQSKYWQLKIITVDTIRDNLSYLLNTCDTWYIIYDITYNRSFL